MFSTVLLLLLMTKWDQKRRVEFSKEMGYHHVISHVGVDRLAEVGNLDAPPEMTAVKNTNSRFWCRRPAGQSWSNTSSAQKSPEKTFWKWSHGVAVTQDFS